MSDIPTTIQQLGDALVAASGPRRHEIVPASATPFSAANAAAITTTTGIAIKAAVAGKKHWIEQAIVINQTTTEDAVTAISDEDDLVYAIVLPADADGVGGARSGIYNFNPPLEIASGKAIEGIGKVAVLGDVWISVHGYVQA